MRRVRDGHGAVGSQALPPLSDRVVLVCTLRQARSRARRVANAELESLLRDLDAQAPAGGPLGHRRGVVWVSLPSQALDDAISRFPRLGYTESVALVHKSRRALELEELWRDDPDVTREQAVDRRAFVLDTPGGPRRVVGYRGSGGALAKRGLPVPDARLLANLASPGVLLDPFAGTGGIAVEALASGSRPITCDIDPVLRLGLAAFGAAHSVADCRALPFTTASIDGIATEPPYDDEADAWLPAALAEMARVTRPGGRIALLCAQRQASVLRGALEVAPFLDEPVDRKGLPVAVLAWELSSRDS